MNNAPLIAFKDVFKTYGSGEATVDALAGVNFEIEAGEFVAIRGPSGSGKSTAMNIMGWLDAPSSGEYLFQGVPTGELPSSKLTLLRRYLLGFVFQGFNLLPRTSALDNVELPLIYRGIKRRQRRELAEQALVQVGLADRLHYSAQSLSGGQQQRVAIARAIVTKPGVLLADEPTGNLDTRTSESVMDLITGLNRSNGITVIVVTHDDMVAAYADRTIRFLDGHLESDLRTRAARETSHVS